MMVVNNLKVPVKKRVFEDFIKLTRRLTSPGKIMVKVGDIVNPEDILAEGRRTSGFRSIPLAKSLQVSAKKGKKYLTVKKGEKVYPGQTLAVRKKLFGKINVQGSIEGIVGSYDEGSGNLLIKFSGPREKLTAACWGKVDKISDRLQVEITTKARKVVGVVGSGRVREGELKILAKPNEFLLPETITRQLAGKIIFGGSQITKAALAKALSLGVAGIVAGGINLDDFLQAGGGKRSGRWFSSDVGLTIVILEGFGLRSVDNEIFKILTDSEGKFCLVDGDTAELIIPQPVAVGELKIDKGKEVGKGGDGEKALLKKGEKVRIVDPVTLGTTGIVENIHDKKEKTETGLPTYLVEIKTSSGKIVQPWQNLEILV